MADSKWWVPAPAPAPVIQEDISVHQETSLHSWGTRFFYFVVLLGIVLFIFFFFTRKGRAMWMQQLSEGLEGDVEVPDEILLPSNATCPHYWVNRNLDGEFDERYEEENLVPIVQNMFDVTWKDIVTRDRIGGKPDRLEVVSVQRFEDRDMWAAYLEQKQIIQKRGRFKTVPELDGNIAKGHVLTDKFVTTLTHGQGLDQSLNEHYLFHGTSPEAAENISEDGFRINLAGSSAGTMFGKGAYFAECCSKADEYAKSGSGGILGSKGFSQEEDEFAILLCRVCCGNMYRALRGREKDKIHRLLHSGIIDGVLGDREEAVGTYREFVVFKEAQVYPEYRVLYRRVYDGAVE